MSKNISLENLQRYDVKIKEHIYKELNKEHLNKGVLEKLSEDSNGNLLYNGKQINGSSSVADVGLTAIEW